MIIVEELFKQIFDTLPIMDIGGKSLKPKFDFGTKEDLLIFINDYADNKITPYPLLWLETPITKTGKEKCFESKVEIDFKLIIATITTANKTNLERIDITFKSTLIPLYENVIKAIRQSGRTKFINENNNQRTDYYNYGLKELSTEKDSLTSTAIWDAIKLDCKLQLIDSNCEIKIIY
ncbi:structural protein [Polaribacter phage Freya_1]|uniref:Structural protein n=1 Tax=Polaribacter phage Freya_1 TaxID=2745662 RepID=A0A8E4ZM90_9CAUD|nr:structural protein [Polaribacter phage Freya_1]QQV90639.1 structural protein [Polaribacter phage Danklef_2]QQV90716.1 structural protein [Polaribacter phage Danklef_3]QQV90793.1 structural protein [Polaribacter phage Danklef_4]QQV90871.1 structural protein [Polaribacter phage Danklef_5]QQV90956.1 structural protein [Polaribacter phage Freya_2]QQV91024.1 structural protein [Polaribacter phage Freya_3]QQV91092.1 structural protein [Polaribacter phage Freya_4]QQV91167.1 structural protein [